MSMSRETEQNISRILKDVRRHSDAGLTSFTGSDSFSGASLTGTRSLVTFNTYDNVGTSSEATCTDDGGLNQEFNSALKWTGIEEEEEICVGMEIEPRLTSGTSLAEMAGDASTSGMDCVDSGSGGEHSSSAAAKFYIDKEGEEWDTIEMELSGETRREEVKQEVRRDEVKQDAEELVRLNQSLKAELEEKGESNSQYRKMMVSVAR